jgi:hypothetical protein
MSITDKKFMPQQEEMIFINHMSQLEKLTDSNGKIEKESNLLHIVKKTHLHQKIPSFP